MLSIKPLKSAQGAVDYYAKAINYYESDATAVCWLGQGSRILNLSDNVDKDKMLELLAGHLPDGKTLQNFKGEHRAGFDMTFSAPKSVSLLVGLGVAPELIKFHDEAVKYAIGQIEKEFAQVRISADNEIKYKNTGNLVIAAFRQPSSRANDPALHTHCVTMNITFLNGEAKSLASDKNRNFGVVEQIQNNAHYCGMLYRTHLANSLKNAKFSLRTTGNGLFEIDGISEDTLTAYSTRRNDIVNLMQKNNWTSAKDAATATLLSRPPKEEHDLKILTADWQKRAQELNFDAKDFMENRKPKQNLFSKIQAKLFTTLEHDAEYTCVAVAVETLNQKTAVFTERELKFASMQHSLTHNKPISHDAIVNAINEHKTKQNLYTNQCSKTNETIFTTPWLLTCEAETITRIENNKEILKSITSLKRINEFQKDLNLTMSQKNAMKLILTTKDRFIAVQGYAGVAKTTMLSHARILIEEKGYNLRGITVASSAANELQTKAKIASDVFPIVHQELKNANAGSLSKTIFIVDEASMFSSMQGHELVKLVEKTDARLILVGDKAQLPSINSSRIFSLIQEYDIKTALMDEIVRQKNPKALEAVRHATNRDIASSIANLEHVEELSTYNERINWLANKWLSQENRDQILLFAPTNANRQDITAIIREKLTEEGTLTGEPYKQAVLKTKQLEAVQQRFVAYYQHKDVIRFNNDFNKVKAGNYYIVDIINAEHRKNNILPLIDESGNKIKFALKHLPQYKIHTSAFERIIEVYRQENLELKIGDKIIWNRNFKACDIRNGQTAKLIKNDKTDLTFITDKDKAITLNKNHQALKHIDYGYVLTNYKVQGKDAQYGIGLMESNNRFSATIKNFYVQISRGILGMTLVTDNKENLINAINKNNDEKLASLDMVSSKQLMNHDARFNRELSIRPVINKQIERELER